MINTMKERIYLISMLVIYTLLGVAGIYSGTLIFLFPVLATPFAIYLIRYKGVARKQSFIHAIIVLSIVLLTGRIEEALLYIVAVAIPAHMVAYFYAHQTPIPKIIMYVGIGVIGVFYIYTILVRSIGIDYVSYYMDFVAEYRTIQMNMFEEMSKMLPDEQMAQQMQMLKDLVNAQVMLLETIYPGLFMLMGIFLAFIQTLIIRIVGKIGKWQLPSMRQLGHFTFAKTIGVLLVIAFILGQVSSGNNDSMTILGMNLFFFLSSLLEILGFISIIVLIKHKKWPILLKVLAVGAIVLLLFTLPMTFMIFGLADTLFNFRKAEIVI